MTPLFIFTSVLAGGLGLGAAFIVTLIVFVLLDTLIT